MPVPPLLSIGFKKQWISYSPSGSVAISRSHPTIPYCSRITNRRNTTCGYQFHARVLSHCEAFSQALAAELKLITSAFVRLQPRRSTCHFTWPEGILKQPTGRVNEWYIAKKCSFSLQSARFGWLAKWPL